MVDYVIRFLGRSHLIGALYGRLQMLVHLSAVVEANEATVIPPIRPLVRQVCGQIGGMLERHDPWLRTKLQEIRTRQEKRELLDYWTESNPLPWDVIARQTIIVRDVPAERAWH